MHIFQSTVACWTQKSVGHRTLAFALMQDNQKMVRGADNTNGQNSSWFALLYTKHPLISNRTALNVCPLILDISQLGFEQQLDIQQLSIASLFPSLYLSLSHTHTHTRTHWFKPSSANVWSHQRQIREIGRRPLKEDGQRSFGPFLPPLFNPPIGRGKKNQTRQFPAVISLPPFLVH